MNTTQPITKLATALLKAQTEIGASKKGTTNPFFHSKYADLGSVMEACKGPLNDNGITILQPVGHDEHGDYVETILLHESGEYISDKMRLISGNKPQEQGSAVSYARRYSLQSLVFIPAEDDDGNTVQQAVEVKEEKTLGEQVKTAECPVHHKPYTLGQYGYYCKSKVGDGWCKNKPYSQLAEKITEEEPPIEAYKN